MKPRILFLITLLCAAMATVQSGYAATFIVTNTNDSGSGTLRQAILDANANAGADTITFAAGVTGTIQLESALSALADDVTISGPGANMLAVERDNAAAEFRIFRINSGKTVTISGLAMTGGRDTNGGGIYNDHAMLTLSNCTLSESGADTNGGGIYNDHGTLTLNNCTLFGNFAASGEGGGIFNDGSTSGSGATLTLNNCTLSANEASSGGGIFNTGDGPGTVATLTVRNSTFNTAALTAGGCISNLGGSNGSATLTVGSTIFKADANFTVPNITNSTGGTVTSLGYNLSSDAGVTNVGGGTGDLNATGDQINTDPMLGPLAYYGGPTVTHILMTGSPAIDKGKNFNGATTDQRGVGFPRTIGSAAVSGGDGTDIGAFERQPNDMDPTLIVNITSDSIANPTCAPFAPCSLREAITAANANAGDDVIYFTVSGTITLNSLGALPNLSSNMKILGPGANALTVKRDPTASSFRIFTVDSGKTATISGLTITGGSSGNGGGILNDHATLTLSNCTISGNSAQGGGIYNDGFTGSATLTINNSTISGNSTSSDGGGIYNYGGSGSATATIKNSTVSGNSAGTFGGGIFSDGNFGSATLTVTNCTLSGNSSGNEGGGINNAGGHGGSATVTIGDTILKAGASGANIINHSGTVTSLGYNLSSDDASALLNQSTDQNNTDPMLDPNGLQNNGGPTLTIGLQPGSPAIDKGINFTSFTTDQRGPGFTRTVGTALVAGGDGTDIGAFEVQNTPPTITGTTISRQQGATSSNSQMATVSDTEDPPTSLTVTVNGGSSSTVNGVTVSGIAIDNSGNVTADVIATCSASNATFTLRVTDTGGLHSDGMLTVNVTPSNAPVITPKAPIVIQQATNHGYRTFTIAQMVQSATDDCDGNVINNVVIEKATSDEVEDSPGGGDGNTLNDIVIAGNCKSVQLRQERDGTLNGRVYLVTLRVSDSSGNIARATYKVSVPVGHNAAVDSGVHYTVNSSCN